MQKRAQLFSSLLFLGLLLWSGVAMAADCAHLNSERQALYKQSSFAHGYIHGYEQGFHLGNQDLQLGREHRDITKFEEYREPAKDYRAQYGTRRAFRAGYRDGIVIGYNDARSGHRFRAIYEARIAAGKVNNAAPASKPDKSFELGFMDGYRAGTIQGVGDGRNRSSYRPQQVECRGAREGLSLGENYCVAYFGGFRFGYSDGYINNDQLVVGGKDGRETILTAENK